MSGRGDCREDASARAGSDIVSAIETAGQEAVADVTFDATRGAVPREIVQELDAVAAGTIVATALDLTLPKEEAVLGSFMGRLTGLLRWFAPAAPATPARAGWEHAKSKRPLRHRPLGLRRRLPAASGAVRDFFAE